VVAWNVGDPWKEENFTVAIDEDQTHGPFNRWEIGGEPMWLDWANPAITNLKNRTWNPEYDVVVENTDKGATEWVYFVIQGIYSCRLRA